MSDGYFKPGDMLELANGRTIRLSADYLSVANAARQQRDTELNYGARQFTDQDGDPIIHAELDDDGWDVERPWGYETYGEFTDILDEARGESK